ncbi:MAG: NAD+ synthase [Thermodesulfobacteriota bacterium]
MSEGNQTLRIAQAQINPTVGNLAANLELIRSQIDLARQRRADLVTFPELAICGYPPEDLLLKPRFLKDTARALDQVVAATAGITAVVGFAEQNHGHVYNSAALAHDGALVAIYRKIELPNYGVFDEKRYFSPGLGCVFAQVRGLRVMLTICEDVWVVGSQAEQCAQNRRPQVVVNISASPFHAGKLDLRRQVLARFAQSTGAHVCYNNLLGGQDELVFDGGCLVISPQGEMLACARRFEADLLVCDLELAPAAEAAAELSPPHRLVSLSGPAPAPALPPAPPACAPELDRLEEVWLALVLGARDYVRKNGFKKVVLGLSGGIDSSLVAAVAVRALGRENVVGVTMPSQFTSSETLSDAELLARNLDLSLYTIPIKAILDEYLKELAPAFGPGPLGVEVENLQARIRGNLLMALSNRFGWMVLTTGNKSETAVGYCTLYGDMAGGFAVIKDVPKTLVYELSAFVNAQAGREIIPNSVIARPPSAELRPDQKDEDSLPPYAVLDPILRAYVEQDKVLDEIAAEGYDPEVVKEVVRLVDLNEYKRRQAPPGVKITPKAFGRDRRLPITNHYRPGWD